MQVAVETSTPEEVVVANSRNCKAHRPGISTEEAVLCYANWKTYDEDLCEGVYNGPTYAAEAISRWMENRDTLILDVAAGSGHVGNQLQKKGFTHVHALEPCANLLAMAIEKKLYRQTVPELISDQPTSIPDDSYDVCVVSGGMGEGHVPCRGMREFVRLTKPGGLVVIVMRMEYLNTVADYRDRLEPFMQQLVDTGYWQQLQRLQVPKYSFQNDGLVYVYRVLIAGCPDYDKLQVQQMGNGCAVQNGH